MTEFIHTADWRIGRRFPGVEPSLRKRLAEGTWQALDLLFIYAKKKHIPLILCAGNAFANGQLADAGLLARLFVLLARYPDIHLVIAPGAEDSLDPGNLYSRSDPSRFPANFQLVTEKKIIPFPGQRLSIITSPACGEHASADPLRRLEAEALPPDTIHVGLCHYPHFKSGDAASLGLDYLACGGADRYYEIDHHCLYPGPPVETGFGDRGFPLHVKIEAPGARPHIKKIPDIAPFEWLEEKLSLTDNTFDEVSAQLGTGTNRHIKKIEISGQLSIDRFIRYQDLLESNRQNYVSIDNRVQIQLSEADIETIIDSNARPLARSLLDLKRRKTDEDSDPHLFQRLKDGTFFMDRQAVAGIADTIPDAEIIDLALIELYRQFGPGA